MQHTNDILATRFITEHVSNPALNYIYIQDQDLFYIYQNGVYLPLEESHHETIIHRFLIDLKLHDQDPLPQNKNINKNLVKDVLWQVKNLLPRRFDSYTADKITFNDNIILDLKLDSTTNKFTKHPATPDLISFFKVDFPSTILNQTTPPERFTQFLNEILVNHNDHMQPDPELIQVVQEMFGYALLDTTIAEKAFILFGSGQNGKTKLLEVLEQLFPPNIIHSDSLDNLTGKQFRTVGIVGKRLLINHEEESKYLGSHLFKKMITGNSITVERKHGNTFNYKPKIKFILGSNHLPTFDAIDFAVRRRLIIIPFNRRIKDNEKDVNLAEKLTKELPLILLWALQGARRIQLQSFEFSHSTQIIETKQRFEESQSSVIEFMNENFEYRENALFPIKELYLFYKEYTLQTGRNPSSKKNFMEVIKDRYTEEGYDFPDEPQWIKQISKSVRVIRHLTPKADQTTWLQESGHLSDLAFKLIDIPF